MKHWQSVLFCTLFVTACDDELDLRLPEGQLPDAPIAVVFHPENADYLELRWTRVPRAAGYHIYTSLESDGEFSRVASVGDTVWRQELVDAFPAELPSGFNLRCYAVTAVVDGIESIPSGQIAALELFVWGRATLSFGLPLTAWRRAADRIPIPRTTSSAAADVFGEELPRGSSSADTQIRYPNDSTANAWRDLTGVWQGDLAQAGFPSGTPFTLQNFSDSAFPVYLCGFVQNGALDSVWITGVTVEGVLASTNYAWRESRRVIVDKLGLLEAGFVGGNSLTSDRVAQTSGGGFAYFNEALQTWHGVLTTIVPGQYYIIVRRQPAGFAYKYEPE